MLLKEKAIQSFNMWASVGKSRNETVFDNMRRDKANYKRAISGIKKKSRANEFSDSLNDALLNKDMNSFGSPGDQSLVLNILLWWLMACVM